MKDLSKDELKLLRSIFKKFENIEEVILFGTGPLHEYITDIDLAIKGKIDINTLSKLKCILKKEITFPYSFDIVIYDNIKDENLKKNIDEYGFFIMKL